MTYPFNFELIKFFIYLQKTLAVSYALEVLTDEKKRIEKALSKWDENHYPDARIIRDRYLRDLTKAIKLITNDRARNNTSKT